MNNPFDISKFPYEKQIAILEGWACDKEADTDTLRLLGKHPSLRVRKCVAWNPQTPEDTLDVLSRSSNGNVLKGVAQNTNSSEKTLLRVVVSPVGNFKKDVLRNKKLSAKSLLKMLRDSSFGFLQTYDIVNHPNANAAIFKEAFSGKGRPSNATYYAIINHPRVTNDLLLEIAQRIRTDHEMMVTLIRRLNSRGYDIYFRKRIGKRRIE